MKILQVGAKSVHVSSYIAALKNSGHEIHLLSEESCNFDGVQHQWHVNFRSMNPFSVLKNTRKLRKILTDLKPALIHIHQVNRLAYFVTKAAKSLGIPVVMTAWGSDVLLIPQQNRFFRFLVTKSLQRSAVVTGDSHEMIAAMNALAPSDKYVHLQYGIDPVTPATKEMLIYSNRLHTPLYRIDSIIRYFSEFSKKHPGWKLVIAATGPETTTLEELVDELDLDEKTIFAGWLDHEQNRSWYAKSAIYCSIPESDGTSASLLEALSAGCIPVVSDLPANREWVTDKQNGIIEQAGSNPFEAALQLDSTTIAAANLQLVEQKAIRSALMIIFEELYRKATNEF